MNAGACICTLQGEELDARVQAWRKVIGRATSQELKGNRIIGRYPKDPMIIDELKGLVQAEAVCCSFLAFRLQELADHFQCELKLPDELPDSMRSQIHGLVGPDHDEASAQPRGAEDPTGAR